MSDWGGTHGTETSLKAGLDLEMPAQECMFYGERLKRMLAEGKIPVADVRKRASVVLQIMARLGMIQNRDGTNCCCSRPKTPAAMSPASSPTANSGLSPVRKASLPAAGGEAANRPKPSPNTKEQQELLFRTAMEGTVVLKNT